MASRDASQNRKAQYDFAQRGLQWKVADAKKAGLHPLAAINATGAFYSPVHSDAPSFARDAGQDLSRAVTTAMTARERRLLEHNAVVRQQMEDDRNLRESNARIENTQADTALIRSQVARNNSAQVGPPAPDAAPGSVDVFPDSVIVGSPGEPSRSPGTVTDFAFGESSRGPTIVPSADMKQRVEDMPSEWQWFLRNGLFPDDNVFRSLERSRPSRPGHEWRYDPIMGHFWQRPLNGRRRHY